MTWQPPAPVEFYTNDQLWTFRINLSTDSYKIGRTAGDYVVQLSDMGDERLYNSVSSTQCEIIKTDVGVFLKDFSTNGKDW